MEHFGTGTGIYIQNGTGVQSFFTVPRDEAKLRESRFWKPEKCFWPQGDKGTELFYRLFFLFIVYNRQYNV